MPIIKLDNGQSQASTSDMTYNLPSGTNRRLLVAVVVYDAGHNNVTAVSIGGNSLSIDSESSWHSTADMKATIWAGVEGVISGSGNKTIAFTTDGGITDIGIGAITFGNVSQGNPYDTGAGNKSGDTTPGMSSINVTDDGILFGGFIINPDSASHSLNVYDESVFDIDIGGRSFYGVWKETSAGTDTGEITVGSGADTTFALGSYEYVVQPGGWQIWYSKTIDKLKDEIEKRKKVYRELEAQGAVAI